jgi:multidrug resistance efflux pump
MPGTTAADERRIEHPTTMEDWTPRGRIPFLRYMLIGCVLTLVGLVALAMVVSVEDSVSGAGLVYPAKDAEVRSGVAGVIDQIPVHLNDRVTAGQVLARLDARALDARSADLKSRRNLLDARCAIASRELERLRLNPLPAEFRDSEAAVQTAQVELKLAEKKLERQLRLREQEAVADATLDQIEGDRDLARIRLEAVRKTHGIVQSGLAEAILAEAQARVHQLECELESVLEEQKRVQAELDRYVLRAPEPGVVVALPKDDGEAVQRGELVAIIALDDQCCIRLRIDEDQFREVSVGQSIRFYSAMYPYREHGHATGKIDLIQPWARQEGGRIYYEAIASVTSTPFELKLGSSVSADIILGRKPLYRMVFD